MMQTKNLTITEMDEAGKGLAVIADLTTIDSDGDGYEPGAFSWKGDQWCQLLTAHNQNMIPFGKARVYEEGGKAYAELNLNLGTQAGRDWHSALLFDLKTGNPVQEWSYGYQALDFQKVMRGLKGGRVLKQVDVFEVSAVVRGAGAGTGTISMKGLKAALKAGEFDELIGGLSVMAETLGGDPGVLSATGRKQLEDIHAALGKALVSSDPEAEAKGAAQIETEAKAQAEIEAIYVNMLTREGLNRHLARFEP
jgi:hypothetical protein